MALDDPSDLSAVTTAVADLLDTHGRLRHRPGHDGPHRAAAALGQGRAGAAGGALSPLLDAAEIAEHHRRRSPTSSTGWTPRPGRAGTGSSGAPTLQQLPGLGHRPGRCALLRPPRRLPAVGGGPRVGQGRRRRRRPRRAQRLRPEPLPGGLAAHAWGSTASAFRASSGRKPEVDVVFTGMQWQGVLSFIETLKELVPFDGFSDPPYVDVSTDGVTAGFDLALPNVAVGVFSLENISLGADVRVPFLGDAVTVGFNFCTREKPFRMTVMCIGGGGFVGLRISPKGLVVLEMSLEAGASLSIDLGRGVRVGLDHGRRVPAPRGRRGVADGLLPDPRRGRRPRPDLGVDHPRALADLRVRDREDGRPGLDQHRGRGLLLLVLASRSAASGGWRARTATPRSPRSWASPRTARP